MTVKSDMSYLGWNVPTNAPGEANGELTWPKRVEIAEKARKRLNRQASNDSRRIANFEKWVRLHEMRGGMHPDLRPWIEECYRIARLRLLNAMTPMLEGYKNERMPPRPEIDYDR